MIYIYDIALNFQKNYYQFFEWNRHDKIKNFSKIPIYRVSDDDIMNLKDNEIIIDKKMLVKFKDSNYYNGKIPILVSNGKITIGLLLDENGKILKKSSLIYEEENEANEVASKLPITEIFYQENIIINHDNKLRIEKEKKESLVNYIKNSNDEILLKYLYYEYFDQEKNNIHEIKHDLLEKITQNWTKKQNEFYHLVILINQNRLSLKERTNSI